VCGFIGQISYSSIKPDKLINANSHLVCRGPDSTQIFNNKINKTNALLIFNRLKIIDLSDNANQPMQSINDESVLVFNGEIYNHHELRMLLEKKNVKFRTNNSDSEVLLNGLEFFGLDFIQKLRGQFSFCFINKKINKAYLVSDRLSQKPMYYSFINDSVIFSSNLLSIVDSLNTSTLSEANINEYLQYGIVSAPNTIFDNIYKLEPAQILEIDLSSTKMKNKLSKYWNPDNYVDSKIFNDSEFFEHFESAIKIRQQADVPIANFLSGGIDSSSIIKNIYDRGDEINSFSVVFDELKYNEQKWSRMVSNKYQTNHLEVNASTILDIGTIHTALNCLDEPYADPSVVPSYIVSNKIADKYKVAISGDGGDELLGGYTRLQRLIKPRSYLENLISKGYSFYPSFLGTGNFFLSKSQDLNLAYSSYFKDEKFMKLLKISSNKIINKIDLDLSYEPYKSLLIQDYKYYLPQMMMFKIDRTSMANSLEVRSPFVDHLLIQYVLSTGLRSDMLNMNKGVLKKYLLDDFSTNFINRKKQGFVFDLEQWVFRNINHIEDTISEGNLVSSFSKNTLKLLSINKSRINANRIWKLYVLEKYFSRI
jgi:asparagine synthase (glutamine-hydrolysing)